MTRRVQLSAGARIQGACRPPISLARPGPDCEAQRRLRAFTQRANPSFQIEAQGGELAINLYDEIGFFGITARQVREALDGFEGRRILLRINSPGGDVFDGIAMHTDLAGHPAEVAVEITGLAASAASVVAMAGDRVEIAPAAFLMIHKAWGFAIGDSDEMRAMGEVLEEIDGALAALYAERSGKEADAIAAMMAAETWMTGEQAVEAGFADALAGEAAGSEAAASFDLSIFHNAPRALREAAAKAARPEVREAGDWIEGLRDLSGFLEGMRAERA